MKINYKKFIKHAEWNDYFNELPELKCNHCGIVFKGEHECEYEKLKEMNEALKRLALWSLRRLDKTHKDFAYNRYEDITKEAPERL